MTSWIAALPMYDWPETRHETDRWWEAMRERLRAAGIAAPEELARCNGDLPPVPGGIRDAAGKVMAPDPASLPPEELDLQVLWRHPDLLLGQTCWGPMEQGLEAHVAVIGQPDYSSFEGGEGAFYSSVLLMRRPISGSDAGGAILPLDLLRGARLAFNGDDSRSGIIALTEDLEAEGAGLDIFSAKVETGSHRDSIRAVAEARADVCAIDCRTWALAQRHEPAAAKVGAIGWTRKRLGLPLIMARGLSQFSTTIASVLGETLANRN